jgi:hypothetical protein
MNPIKKVFKDLTDTELKEMVLEIQEAEKTGVFIQYWFDSEDGEEEWHVFADELEKVK